MARHAHEILVRALQLGGLAGVAVAASQVLWSQAASGGAAGMFTTDPAVLTASNAVLLLVYIAMVSAVPVTHERFSRLGRMVVCLRPSCPSSIITYLCHAGEIM